MERTEFRRLIDTVFAAKGGEEMSRTDYFDQLPRYVELEAAVRTPRRVFPKCAITCTSAPSAKRFTSVFSKPCSPK